MSLACSGALAAPTVVYVTAIREGLERVREFAAAQKATVHMPRIGCGLAGGKWDEVAAIIEKSLVEKGIGVTVYDLPKEGCRTPAPH